MPDKKRVFEYPRCWCSPSPWFALALSVQGLTLLTVVRTSGLAVDPARLAATEAKAHARPDESALDYLDDLRESSDVPDHVLDRLRRRYTARLGASEDEADPADAFTRLHHRLLDVQRTELRRAGALTRARAGRPAARHHAASSVSGTSAISRV